ncbi:MAG TPA: DUF4307 domain-containing protein [Lacisediminihabitans sp.]|uniref:DUF4307 domain-containing protein n=1 Tax=Lacisediminihabitans sp. TaxID=2787631 RepID=UPI002ED9A448
MIAIDETDLAAGPPSDPESPTLAARYGRTPAKRRRDRWIYIIGGIVAAIVVVTWVLWAGLDQAGGNLDAEDTGHVIMGDRAVSISYQVSMPVGSTAECALQVQNEAHGIVGWRVVRIPAATEFTTSHTTTVRSSEQAVTGLIYRCWLT